ncbi:MAG TPA: glycosyltransferase [Steroidobacteraceae bacterium]|nr:glycosyltransferase [Steroidobacteraceae bacterium]
MRALKRCVLRLEDWARISNLNRIKSLALRARAFSPRARVFARSWHLIAWHPVRHRAAMVAKTLALAARDTAVRSPAATLVRSVLLKPRVSAAERGVLLVSFERELAKLAELAALGELEQEYAIVFVPTWQPFYSAPLFAFAARARRPYWIMPSSARDQALCADFGPLCRPLPFQASSWVSRAQYAHLTCDKTIDLLMLANFDSYKRHWRLFEALADLPRSLCVVLAGRSFGGRTAATLRGEADAFGVRERIEIREDPSDHEVAALLATARVFCALSHREGSYIAIAEALMAGTPVAMFADAVVGSREYIGPQTGWFLDPQRALGPQLLGCLEHAAELQPRTWASSHISAEVNGPRLNAILRQEAGSGGEVWTRDLQGFFCRHFDFEYFDVAAESALHAEYQRLRTRFGLEIVRPASAAVIS